MPTFIGIRRQDSLSGDDPAEDDNMEPKPATRIAGRHKQALLAAISEMKPDLHYTAGDMTYHAAKHGKTSARYLKPKNASRILCALQREGAPIQMHPRGIEDENGKVTTQRTFTVIA